VPNCADGLRPLRHFYASWCINRRADGGLELPLKLVQGRLGHASIQITADRYGHLFPSETARRGLTTRARAALIFECGWFCAPAMYRSSRRPNEMLRTCWSVAFLPGGDGWWTAVRKWRPP
jgi:hypothetical protein